MHHSAIYDPRANLTPSQREAALERAKRIDRIAARSHPDSPVVCLSASQRGGRHVKCEIREVDNGPDVSRLSRADRHRSLGGSPLDPRYTLSRFIPGQSNLIAHAAAVQISSEKDAVAKFNPLFIHGPSGLGKSHLLQGIAAGSERTSLYMTADRFAANSTERAHVSFMQRIDEVGIILIDDIQFLRSVEARSMLNALIDRGHQLVVAGDRPPIELEDIGERLQSRLAGGLVVELRHFSAEVFSALARSYIAATAHRDFEIDDQAFDYLSKSVARNGREIEGAVNRLIAFFGSSGSRITLEIAEQQLRDLVRPQEVKRIKIEDIQIVVARRYGMPRSELLSARRTKNIVRPRQIAIYLSKLLTLQSLPYIGRRFGGRDHTTILHAVRKMEALKDKDSQIAQEIISLEKQLRDL